MIKLEKIYSNVHLTMNCRHFLKKHFLLNLRPNFGDVLCDKCQRRHYKNEEQKSKTADVIVKLAIDDCIPPAPNHARKCTSPVHLL